MLTTRDYVLVTVGVLLVVVAALIINAYWGPPMPQ